MRLMRAPLSKEPASEVTTPKNAADDRSSERNRRRNSIGHTGPRHRAVVQNPPFDRTIDVVAKGCCKCNIPAYPCRVISNQERRFPMYTNELNPEYQAYLQELYLSQKLQGAVYSYSVRRVFCGGCRRMFYTQVRNKKYCSRACCKVGISRQKHDRLLKKRKDTLCACCGKPFTATRAGAKYCSNACRQKAYRHR